MGKNKSKTGILKIGDYVKLAKNTTLEGIPQNCRGSIVNETAGVVFTIRFNTPDGSQTVENVLKQDIERYV